MERVLNNPWRDYLAICKEPQDGDEKDDSDSAGAAGDNADKEPVSQRSEPKAQQLNMVVDPDVMEYVTSTSHQGQLKKTLAARKSEVSWKPKNKMAVIVYHGEDKSDSWQSECSEEVQNCLGKFTTLEVEIKRDCWEAVKTQLSSIHASFGVDPPLIKPIDDAFVTKMVCLRSVAKKFEEQLKAKLEKVYQAETRKSSLAKERLILLKMKFKLQEIDEEVEVKLEPETQNINPYGPHSLQATVKFNKLTLDVAKKKLNVSKSILEVLSSDQGQQMVKRELEKNKVEAVFTIDSEASVAGTSASQADKAATLVSKLTLEEKVRVDDKDHYLLKTPEWRQQCEVLNTREVICVYQKNGSDTFVAGFREDVKDAIKKLSTYIENHCIHTEKFTCPSRVCRRYLSELRQDDLRSIETQLKNFEVKIQNGGADDDFVISGKKEGLKRAIEKLNNLLDVIESEKFEVKQPGLRKFCSGGKWDRLIKSTEKDKACLIDAKVIFDRKLDGIHNEEAVDSDDTSDDDDGISFDEDDDDDDEEEEEKEEEEKEEGEEEREEEAIVRKSGPSTLVTTNGQIISWRAGDIATEKAEILVSSQGKCSEAIISAGGQAMKVKHPNAGDITVTPGYNLPCSHVIHTACSMWNGGVGETILQGIVQKSLRMGEELGGTSIAFPIIGTGRLNFPPGEASRIMLEEVISFCLANPSSTVKDIRFVVYQQNEELVTAFQQEMANLLSKHKLSPRKFSPGYTVKRFISNLQSKLRRNMTEIPRCRVGVKVLQGDLCKESTDAIVNINGQDMNMHNAGGLSKAVLHASGTVVQDECSRVGPQAVGSVVMTGGGNLAARNIIHLVPDSSSKSQLRHCVQKCLKLAESKGFQSISFPAVGTGSNGLSAADSADLMFQALSNFSANFNTIRKVRIVVFQAQMLPAFQQEQQRHPLFPRTVVRKRVTKMKGPSIEVIKGDLTQETTDAIMNINSTDMNLNNAGELSKAILRCGGQQIQQECFQLGKQTAGSAVLTSGGNLPSRSVIHIVPGSGDKQHLQTCLETGLRLADAHNFQSISIPCIGTGGYGLAAAVSAQFTFQALNNFSETCKGIRKVRVVVFQDPMMQDFVQAQQTQAIVQDVNESDSDSSLDGAVAKQPRERRSRMIATNNNCVEICVAGNDKTKVKEAVESLKEGLSEAYISHEVENVPVSLLTQKQIETLTRKAKERDVKLEIEVHLDRILVQGDPNEVPGMVGEIWREINERNKKIHEEQETLLVSKNVEWSYKINKIKTVIDPNTSKKIETAYSRGKDTVKVPLREDHFVIDLKEKTGRGRKTGERIKLSRKVKAPEEEIPLPKYWAPMPRSEMTVHTVKVAPSSPEYQDVMRKVQATASSVNIQKIERVQNPHLYQTYMLRKQKMDSEIGGNSERQLFHGTDPKNIPAINTQGFNRSFHGVHGAKFGQGVYFARDASYSVKFSAPEDGVCCIYLARVLVGQYCKGDSSMIIPPPKDKSKKEIVYESVVDNPGNPTIFVVFHDNQCYPEYLITFK